MKTAPTATPAPASTQVNGTDIASLNANAQKLRDQLAAAELQALNARNAKLQGLHTELGYENRALLIKDLRGLDKGPSSPSGRGKVTDEIKDKVRKMVKDGKTGAEIAKEVSLSVPTIQNIKKELGLVKARA